MSLGVAGEKLLLGFEEFGPELSERILALVPPQGWWHINHSRLAPGMSPVAFDASMAAFSVSPSVLALV